MSTEIQARSAPSPSSVSPADVPAAELIVAGFGKVDSRQIDIANKQYYGRLYDLELQEAKSLAETLGFTANFDSSSVRTACIDIFEQDAKVSFEVTRNTRPTDLALRYMRDRWQAVESVGKSSDGTLTTTYQAQPLPDRVLAKLAEQLRLADDDRTGRLIRVNLKQSTLGLIVEIKNAGKLPEGEVEDFTLPFGLSMEVEKLWQQGRTSMAAVEALEAKTDGDSETGETKSGALAMTPTKKGENDAESSSGAFSGEQKSADRSLKKSKDNSDAPAKYATYSQSEIDRMLKIQTENITASLTTKISSQQKAFQDAVLEQEKSFVKTVDKLNTHFDEARGKLEASSKSSQDNTRQQLEQFKSELAKELEQFRTHINKSVLPNLKTIDDKIQTIHTSVETSLNRGSTAAPINPLLWAAGAAVVFTLVNGVMLYFAFDRLSSLEQSQASVRLELLKGGRQDVPIPDLTNKLK